MTHILPFTAKDFGIRPLPDRLFDLNYLAYLFPNIPKDVAFGKYCTQSAGKFWLARNTNSAYGRPVTDLSGISHLLVSEPESPTSNGYVKPFLVTKVPGVEQAILQQNGHANNPMDPHTAVSGGGFSSYPNTPDDRNPSVSPGVLSAISAQSSVPPKYVPNV